MALSGQNGKNASLLIHLLDGRWTMEMLTTLAGRGRRYQDLYEALDGIAYKVRTDTLRRSERGRSLDAPLATMAEWTDRNWQAVEAARHDWNRRRRQTGT